MASRPFRLSRQFAWAPLVVALGLALAGCPGKGTQDPAGRTHRSEPPAVASADRAHAGVTLRYYAYTLGQGAELDQALTARFEADTGIKIQYIPVNTDVVTQRAVTSPNSFDLIDTEYFSLKKIVPTGNLKGIDTKKIKNADKITPL
ncbi:MAG: hypothetical protein ACK46X_15680, partial [Candidatus Sericytochromatia bacterium]